MLKYIGKSATGGEVYKARRDGQVERVAISELRSSQRASNSKPDQDLLDSMRKQGQREPILAYLEDGQVIDGHHRLAAAKLLGWSQVLVKWKQGRTYPPGHPWYDIDFDNKSLQD